MTRHLRGCQAGRAVVMTQQLLSDLARVKALFQLRTIKAVINERPKDERKDKE